MTVEPMTDIDRIRAQWVDDLRGALAAHKHDKHMQVSPLALACLFKALDEAKATISTLATERDAAVARAMPEPVLVRTVEEVGALTTGAYRIAAPWQPRRWILGWRHPPGTWTLLIGAVASGVKDDHIVGSWVQRLPDLPTPTAAQEGQGNG